MRPKQNLVTPQLPLPLPPKSALSRADFIVAPANANAIAFIDAWPDWPVSVLAIYGPAGCGKTHLASIWKERSGAEVISAAELCSGVPGLGKPLVIEDVDSASPTSERDTHLFSALESAGTAAPLLLTGHERPADWACILPDLASRLRALPALPLWVPDDASLAALAHKLFADRQLVVPEVVIGHMLLVLERSPGAIRDFVDETDKAALAEARAVNLSLVRKLIAARERSVP